MEVFAEVLKKVDNPEHRERMEELLTWVSEEFPSLSPVVKWNQPMFTDRDTYIIGFSASKKHVAVAPEQIGISHFLEEIEEAGFDHTKELVRFKWNSPFDYDLLKKMIEFNIVDKADCTTFWRK
ncbi:iron chaperone [Sutcliffiella rhizosphaerae]|uniref:Intracellular iron chaperone frataxin n=1 Tax=Sutcliffiella rhizosphaerae TaxID=2880967 RepID=A0ABN8AEJ9_9BACI|nr:iron chaperone [Sutcliffiella rhizosphaerae]CAG9623675.1 Intracellular iron chaperone frataxin [Sutcliffiella rhizosphaerae]